MGTESDKQSFFKQIERYLQLIITVGTIILWLTSKAKSEAILEQSVIANTEHLKEINTQLNDINVRFNKQAQLNGKFILIIEVIKPKIQTTP